MKGAQRQNALDAARRKSLKLIRKHSGDSFKINSVINSLFLGAFINCEPRWRSLGCAHLFVAKEATVVANICPQPPLQADVGKLAIVEMPL